MGPLALVEILAILSLTLAVPFAFRYLWPGGVARPPLFLVVTLTLALVVAAIAISWFAQLLTGVGIAGPSANTTRGRRTFRGATAPPLLQRLSLRGGGAVLVLPRDAVLPR